MEVRAHNNYKGELNSSILRMGDMYVTVILRTERKKYLVNPNHKIMELKDAIMRHELIRNFDLACNNWILNPNKTFREAEISKDAVILVIPH